MTADSVSFWVLAIVAIVIFGMTVRKCWAKKSVIPHVDEEEGSFAERAHARQTERELQFAKVKAYNESIDNAFEKARADGALRISQTTYDAILFDRNSKTPANALLTRFSVIMPVAFAERVRECEIELEHSIIDSKVSEIIGDARNLMWRVEEVPRKFEPKNIHRSDKVQYPEDYGHWSLVLPPSLTTAARELLGYDDQYVEDQAELRRHKDD